MMVRLSKASTEKEVDEIINEHNQIEMSDAEKLQYSDNVIADTPSSITIRVLSHQNFLVFNI